MGWRFRQIVRLGPLLRLNFSKSGVSLSAGKPGLTFNVGRGRAKTTVSAPGTGISYQSSTRLAPEETNDTAPEAAAPRGDDTAAAPGKTFLSDLLKRLARGR